MINKRFLVPILALAAFGLPASASIVPYCDNGCGSNTTAAFGTLIAPPTYSYAYVSGETFVGTLSDGGDEYLDSITGIEFFDSKGFTITGSGALETNGTHDTITITVPASFIGVALSVSSLSGASNYTFIDPNEDGTQLSTTPTGLDYVNEAPGAVWSITITAVSPENILLDAFNAATLAGTDGSGGSSGGSETPEVGTLLLIGSGLIAMRYMRRIPRRVQRRSLTPQTA
jgi:hypothetical protein